MTRKKIFRITGIVLLAALIGIGYLIWKKSASGALGKQVEHPDRIYTVQRGEMQIGFVQSGAINAKKKHKLALEAPFNTTLISTVSENAKVKAGELLMQFETEDLIIKLDNFKLNLDNHEKELAVLIEERRILESSNQADIRSANDKLINSRDTYAKYRKLEGPKDMDQQDLAVSEAKRKFEDAKKAYEDYSIEIAETVFINQSKEDEAEQKVLNLKQAMDKEKINHKNAMLNRKIFKRYTYPNKLKDLTNAIAQAELDLEKTIVRASAQTAQKDNQITNLEARIRQAKRDIEKHTEYLGQMKLISPVDGVVIYGDPDRRWGNPDIQEGMNIRRGQILITIPDMSNLIVDFDLAERFRSRVEKGTRVFVTPDSIPGIKVSGKISSIASLPVNQIHWDASSPKIYKSVIEMDEDNPQLVSGMSVQIEVVTDTIEDTIYVPIEAVFEEQGEYYVYLAQLGRPQRCTIKIGKSNDNYVQILDGLKERDAVYLYRPFQSKQGE